MSYSTYSSKPQRKSMWGCWIALGSLIFIVCIFLAIQYSVARNARAEKLLAQTQQAETQQALDQIEAPFAKNFYKKCQTVEQMDFVEKRAKGLIWYLELGFSPSSNNYNDSLGEYIGVDNSTAGDGYAESRANVKTLTCIIRTRQEIETCEYKSDDNTFAHGTVYRYRIDTAVYLIDLETNQVRHKSQFEGSAPAACPSTMLESQFQFMEESYYYGDYVSVDEIIQSLRSYWTP